MNLRGTGTDLYLSPVGRGREGGCGGKGEGVGAGFSWVSSIKTFPSLLYGSDVLWLIQREGVGQGLTGGGGGAKYIGNKEIKAGHCLRREQSLGGGGGRHFRQNYNTLHSTAQMVLRPLLFLK